MPKSIFHITKPSPSSKSSYQCAYLSIVSLRIWCPALRRRSWLMMLSTWPFHNTRPSQSRKSRPSSQSILNVFSISQMRESGKNCQSSIFAILSTPPFKISSQRGLKNASMLEMLALLSKRSSPSTWTQTSWRHSSALRQLAVSQSLSLFFNLYL